MNLAKLLLELEPLVQSPKQHWDKIVALLDKHQDLAEYQVARFYVARHLGESISARATSRDPRERRDAVRAIKLTLPRTRATYFLRRLVKDADNQVRYAAGAAARELAVSEVALPDTRYPAPRNQWERRGGWNVTGWAFGLTRPRRAAARKRPDAVTDALKALPKLADVAAVAKLVGADKPSALRRFLRPGVGTGSAYVEFEVPKATGGVRTISAPRAALKKVQRAILREILDKVPAHDAAHGFVRGRSVVTNAEPHQGAAVVVKMDLEDFFPTIHYRRVAGLFEELGYDEGVAGMLAGLTTHRTALPSGKVAWPGVLPQGAPTSPALANLLCRRLDSRLAGLARKAGGTYTRYADDLTFSFKQEPSLGLGRFLWWVDQVCQQEGFNEKVAKRRVLRASNQQRVTGVVVNSGLFVPREARRRFRAVLHNCRREGIESQARGRKHFRDYLRGFAAYVKMVQPDAGAALVEEVRELLTSDPTTATAKAP